MTNTWSRRGLLAALAAGAASPVIGQGGDWPTARPRPRPANFGDPAARALAGLVEGANLTGSVGVALVDMTTGEVLSALQPDVRIPPASVTKAATSVYALNLLGADYRFGTELLATGPVRGGVLEGDLVLAGGGDPTLDTAGLASLASGLAEAGVREVSGRFVVWAGALPESREIGSEQMDYASYNPAVGGLNLNFNRVHFEWLRKGQNYEITMEARADNFRPAAVIATMDVQDRSGPVFSYTDQGGIDSWTVTRSALGDKGARWLPVRRPAAYAAEVFRLLAKDEGIVLRAPVKVDERPAGTVIARHQSDDLRTVLREMLKYSTNLTAEAVGMAASTTTGDPFNGQLQSAARMTGWFKRKLALTTPYFADHSGLGYATRISALDMAGLLTRTEKSDDLWPLMKPVNLADVPSGTMVHAKTGTHNFVSALAGYLHCGSRQMAFAIFAGDAERRDGVPVELREKPLGSASYLQRARNLQKQLLQHWAKEYA